MSSTCGGSDGQNSSDGFNTCQGSSHQANGGSGLLEKLVNDWSYRKGILQHLVNKARSDFANSERVNDFPQCTWFEEDDLLFEDTMTECGTNVDDAYIVGDVEKLRKTTNESITDLNEIVICPKCLTYDNAKNMKRHTAGCEGPKITNCRICFNYGHRSQWLILRHEKTCKQKSSKRPNDTESIRKSKLHKKNDDNYCQVEEAERWIHDMEQQLSNDNYGDTLIAVQELLNEHTEFSTDFDDRCNQWSLVFKSALDRNVDVERHDQLQKKVV